MPEIPLNSVKVSSAARTAQATILEVPVTIQGSRSVEGKDQRELFTETAKTTLVFERGAVVSLKARVLAGQCVFLRNELSGREILCKVAESRPAGDANYTDLEFTAHDPKFWEAPAAQPVPPEQKSASQQIVAAAGPKSTAQELIDAAVQNLAATPDAESAAPSTPEMPAPDTATAALASASLDSATALPEPAHDAEPNEMEDAEHLAALIALDDKSRATRESAAAGAKDAKPAKGVEDGPQRTPAASQGASGTRPISELEMRIRTLANFKALRSPVAIGIAASFLIAATLGTAWHLRRVSSMRNANRTAAASSRPKPQPAEAPAQSAQTQAPGTVTGAVVPARETSKTQLSSAAQAPGVNVAQNSAARATGLAAVREPKAAKLSQAPAVISVAATIPGSDRSVVAKPRHRKTNDPDSPEITPAKIVAQSQPSVPQWAKGLDVDGVVQLDALIDANGNVTETTPLSGPRMLQREAERVVALWIFEPATSGGKPTATHMVLTVQFQM